MGGEGGAQRRELALGLQPAEALGGLEHGGGGPAQRHGGVAPALHVAADAPHRAHDVLDDVVVALHMVLSWSRREAIVWARSRDELSWQTCHTGCFSRLGGVPATVRVDDEKTAVVRGAGAWGTI